MRLLHITVGMIAPARAVTRLPRRRPHFDALASRGGRTIAATTTVADAVARARFSGLSWS